MLMLSLQQIARALGGEVSGSQVLAPGPSHSASDRSLCIKLDPSAPDGFVVHSFAGDDPIASKDYVRSKAGIEPFKANGKRRGRASDTDISAIMAAAVQSGETEPPQGKIVTTYDYTDDKGELLYQVCRLEPKSFRQRRPDGKGGWIWSVKDCRHIPYRLPELLKDPDACVFVCEGEKDSDRVASLDHCATTVACGDWTDDCVNALAGRDVLILEDNDDAGRKKAHEAASALHGRAKSVRVVRLPGLPEKGDVSDWLDADQRNAGKLAGVRFAAQSWTPAPAPATPSALPAKLTLSSAEFVAGFVPPVYLFVGWLQRRFVSSLTAATGDGKTAIALLISLAVSQSSKLGKLEVKRGRVLYFAGENPDDVRMRWMATTQQVGLAPEDIDNVHFVPGVFK